MALTAWLDTHQDVTRLAWIDDDLGPLTTAPQNTREQLRNYHSELASRLDDVLLIAPPPEYGITPAQLELLTGWVTASSE